MVEDTSFIIDILREDDDALTFLELLGKEQRPEKVSSITVLELYEGFERSSASDDRRQSILDVLETKHVIAADLAVMRRAGRLPGELIAEGAQIDREDCIIAAIALLVDEPAVTRNTAHFDRIDELDVQTY